MQILVIGDIHNDVEKIMSFSDNLELLKFDAIVCPGDFTDIPPRGFSRTDIAKVILEQLKLFGKPIFAVPGNFDKDIIELLEKENVNIHGRGKILNEVGFYGYGGAKTPFNTSLEPSESEMKSGLETAFSKVKNSKYKVQVTHNPAFGTKLDMIYTGVHVGSVGVREFILENKPNVAVSAHIHEARGVDEIGQTKLINAGRFPEGYYGLISIKNGVVEVKVENLI